MSVGLLVIAHNQVGEALLEAASDIFKSSPLSVKVLSVYPRSNFEGLVKKSSQYLQALDTGHGVLVLTDLFGSTPSNIANKLVSETVNSAVIAGVNLPMLIRIFNYSQLELKELAVAAYQGGRNGIVSFDSNGVD
ncbi:MAG: PTS fructose transporter subunit IIA [Gammaproteobacteria bacterium]|nr:PTS fructose transporter subunit IIA [Gammaproteobacteria bacterium]